jgi:hypothetical protein
MYILDYRAEATLLLNSFLRNEYASKQILARDKLLPRRAAFRFVDNPSFMSSYRGRWKIPNRSEVFRENCHKQGAQ